MARIISLFVRSLTPRCAPSISRKTPARYLHTSLTRNMASTSYLANLPPLPTVRGTDPERCILDAFRIAIAKTVADALPPLTVEQVYQGVDYGKKGVDFTIALPRFRLPGKVDEHAKKVIEQVSA